MKRLCLAAVLLLGACDQPTPQSTEAQAYDAARDVSQPKFDALQEKIDSLETQINQQRAEIDGLESDEASLRSSEKVDSANINTAFENHNDLLKAYKAHLRQLHGIAISD